MIDGGALLHRVHWCKDCSYGEIIHQYCDYLETKYGQRTVVFDGYDMSTKDHEHKRRSNKVSSADVKIAKNIIAHRNQHIFLSNDRNKDQFIDMLKNDLLLHNFRVLQSESDADTSIVQCALELASSGRKTTVIADDPDILVLLLHHYLPTIADIYYFSEASKRRKDGPKVFSIRNIFDIIDSIIRKSLIFDHAWSGCDCTPAAFGQGKGAIIKLLLRSKEVQEISQTFYKPDATHVEVAQGGIRLFTIMYGGRDGNLNRLRYTTYMNAISATKGLLKPEKLPPTENAAEFHSYRVHIQVLHWNSFLDTNALPTYWGWKVENGIFTPIPMTLGPAPEGLLNFIRCNCKPTSRNPHSTNICSCRKNSLPCVAACGNCHGDGCGNARDEIDCPDDQYSSSHEDCLDRNAFDIFA